MAIPTAPGVFRMELARGCSCVKSWMGSKPRGAKGERARAAPRAVSFRLCGMKRPKRRDPTWATPTTLFTGFAFAGMIYFLVSFAISRYALFVERRLNTDARG